MSIELEILKNLRAKGASVQMQEDIAGFVGGYDNPLFMPTIDFILQLQNQAKNQSQEQTQSVDLSNFDIPKVYDPTYFNKISLKATGEAIRSSNIGEAAKQEILNYLDNMEIQRAKHLGVIGLDRSDVDHEVEVERNIKKGQAKKRDRGTAKTKSMLQSLVSRLSSQQVNIARENSERIQEQQENQQQIQQQMRLRDVLMRAANRVLGTKAGEQGSKDSKTLAQSEKSFLRKMRKILRPNKLEKKNTESDGENALGLKKNKDLPTKNQLTSEPDLNVLGAKKGEKKTGLELFASSEIDKTIKEKKLEKDEKRDEKDDEKDSQRARVQRMRLNQRLQQQREDAQHQAERLDKMTAEKAMKLLHSSGVSLGDSDHSAVNKDLNQLAKNPEKQRGS